MGDIKRFITLDINNKVVSTREATSIIDGEIESGIGEIGQIRQEDGTFIDDSTPPPEPVMSDIDAKINYIYLKQKGLI